MRRGNRVIVGMLSTATAAIGLALFACVGEDPAIVGGTSDAAGGADGTAASDAGGGRETGVDEDASTGPRCSADQPFDVITPLAELNGTTFDSLPRLSPDEQRVYFSRGQQIYTASRSTEAAKFDGVAVLPIADAGQAYHPTIQGDGLAIVFSAPSSAGAGLDYDIWRATKANVAEPSFMSPTRVAATVNTTGIEEHPYLLPTGTVLYFRREAANTPSRIFRSAYAGSAFGTAVELDLATPSNDKLSAPAVSEDETTIYFASTESDPMHTQTRIWVATRKSPIEAFGNVRQVLELAAPTSGGEEPGFVSKDLCRLYFDRVVGNRDIYVAKRSPK